MSLRTIPEKCQLELHLQDGIKTLNLVFYNPLVGKAAIWGVARHIVPATIPGPETKSYLYKDAENDYTVAMYYWMLEDKKDAVMFLEDRGLWTFVPARVHVPSSGLRLGVK